MNQVALLEHVPAIKGALEIVVKRGGVVVLHDTDDNLILNAARSNMAKLLAGQGENLSITHIGVGTNGDAPSPDDVRLTDEFVKPITSFSFPTSTSVRFDFVVQEHEANGLAIREFGLRAQDGSYFARRTRNGKVIEKEDDMEIYGYWTIMF